ncbi:Type IV fimbrial biogenesis protein PilY1 [gamma proteobacterium IMCC1989]|nr:Type IV fimbrial biogenesis protein PilY1 [gamma proteobacterium IMCC1989]
MNKQKRTYKTRLCLLAKACVLAGLPLYSVITIAAPGVLSEKPLSLVTSTKPNILLLLDDSGSMDFKTVVSNEAQVIHSVDVDNDGVSVSRDSLQTDKELGALCTGYNSLAFNPEVKYSKWKDYTGNTFDNVSYNIGTGAPDLTAVVDNPLDPSVTVDLSKNIYFRWDDDDKDGIYDVGECGPSVDKYDALAGEGGVISLPKLTDTPYVQTIITDEYQGVFSDGEGDYRPDDEGILQINIPGGGDVDGDEIIFEVIAFNVDVDAGTDSLTVYGGIDIATSPVDAVTVTHQFGFVGDQFAVSGTYIPPKQKGTLLDSDGDPVPLNVTGSSLRLNDSNGSNRYNEISQFTVSGGAATLVFDGGGAGLYNGKLETFVRSGFVISWYHSRLGTRLNADSFVTASDCTDGTLAGGELSHCVVVSDLPATEALAPTTSPYNNQDNYATWYTYHRDRISVAKKALSDVVYDSDYRVGFATINDSGLGGALIRDMENEADDSITSYKSDLLQKIYATRTVPKVPDGSNFELPVNTPLIKALSNAGRYFTEGKDPDEDFFGTTNETSPFDSYVATTHAEPAGSVLLTVPKSPILTNDHGGQCQQNFTLLFTDGAWTDEVSDYFSSDHDVNEDAGSFVGDQDSAGDYAGGVYADGAGAALEDTLADVAMYYFANDLAPSVSDSLSLDLHNQLISHQHMVTFSVGFGVKGDVDATPSIYDRSGSATSIWPSIINPHDTVEKIDDLHHAAFNGRGAYVNASNSENLKTELDSIITEIGVRVGNTATGASFSSFELIDGEFRFDTNYETVNWSGDLKAFEYISATNQFAEAPTWSADERMESRVNRESDRQIITYNGTKGIPFQFSFSTDYRAVGGSSDEDKLSATQVEDLLTLAPYITGDLIPYKDYAGSDAAELEKITKNQAYGEVLVNYLRGDGSYDGLSLDKTTTASGVSFDSDIDASSLYSFRDRNGRYIGSLVHSQPEFAKVPNNSYPDQIASGSDTDLYSTFVSDKSDQRAMIYVGGNDGMLHGFYAKNTTAINGDGVEEIQVEDGGQEVFAYIPSMLSDTQNGGKGLHQLSQSTYEGLAYVDGSPNVSDVFVDRAPNTNFSASFIESQWRTYLVGGLRAGGKGIYVLDVTNPDIDGTDAPNLSKAEGTDLDGKSVAEKVVVNEFTHEKLGHIYGRPKIGKMNNGRWAAIVGNGYNSSSTESGTASLFIVYLDAPQESINEASDINGVLNSGNGDYTMITASENSWYTCANTGDTCTLPAEMNVRYGVEGDYHYSTTPLVAGDYTCDSSFLGIAVAGGATCSYSDSNGLSQPEIVDLDGNGTIDRIYAGDLHGNMWVFDVSTDGEIGAKSWTLHNNQSKPLFTACAGSLSGGVCKYSERQPITSKPLIRNNPIRTLSGDNTPNKMVFFGTGQYLTDSDPGSIVDQSFYTVWDAGANAIGLSKSDLIPQTIESFLDGAIRKISSSPVNYSLSSTPKVMGWYYVTLPGSGIGSAERVTLAPLFIGNIVIFYTLIPNEGICNARAGSGYIMAVDALTGGNPPISVLGVDGGDNIAGKKVGSVIVGGGFVKTDDDSKLITKTANKDVTTETLTPDDLSDPSVTPGDLFKNRGRKSWSILR